MTVTIFVPRDSTALALGANETAAAIEREAKARGIDIKLVRNGSRGMFWLEPLVEVATDAGRIGFGPIEEHEVAGLFDAGFTTGRQPPESTRPDRRNPLPEETGTPAIRARRYYRSCFAGRLPGA